MVPPSDGVWYCAYRLEVSRHASLLQREHDTHEYRAPTYVTFPNLTPSWPDGMSKAANRSKCPPWDPREGRNPNRSGCELQNGGNVRVASQKSAKRTRFDTKSPVGRRTIGAPKKQCRTKLHFYSAMTPKNGPRSTDPEPWGRWAYFPSTMEREILPRARSTSTTQTVTLSPTETTSLGCRTKRFAILEICTSPS